MNGRCVARGTALAALLWAASQARDARADGRSVCASGDGGGLRVTLFTSPTPLRVGTAELAVLVQDAASGAPLPSSNVRLGLATPGQADGARALDARAGADANRLLHAASVTLDAAGRLELSALVESGGRQARVDCVADVAAAPPPLLAHWPLLALPPFAVALHAVNRLLAAQQAARRQRARRPRTRPRA